MKIIPKNGIDELLFGMKQNHVEAILGKPSSLYKDEDENVVCVYNNQKMKLTFYEDEAFRLGYIEISHQEVLLFDKKIIGRKPEELLGELANDRLIDWEENEDEGLVTYFNEDNWILLNAEFDEIIKVEIGALIVNDEFQWKFKA